MWQLSPIVADLLLRGSSNHYRGSRDIAAGGSAESLEKSVPAQNFPLCILDLFTRRENSILHANHWCRAICENDFRVLFHDRCGTAKGARREKIICAKYDEVASGRPIDAFIEGC